MRGCVLIENKDLKDFRWKSYFRGMTKDIVTRLHERELFHILKQIFLPLSPDHLALCRSNIKIIKKHIVYLILGILDKLRICNYCPITSVYVTINLHIRDERRYQNGWIFGKIPNSLLSPSFSENHVAIFLSEKLIKRPCLKVQNLQNNYLYWKWPPTPLWNISKIPFW